MDHARQNEVSIFHGLKVIVKLVGNSKTEPELSEKTT